MPDAPLQYTHLPPASDGPAPTAVVLHGRGADEADLLPVARELPDTVRVISLRAPDPFGPGYTWFHLDSDSDDGQPDRQGFRRALACVTDAIAWARTQHAVTHVGLLGFSQGAIVSLALLAAQPDDYAWTVALHGYLPANREPTALNGTPMFIAAGDHDQVIAAERVTRTADRFREAGADVTVGTYPTGHGIGREELADLRTFVDGVE